MDQFIKAFEAGIDRTLLRENLRLTPQQRFDKFDAFMHGVMELKQAGERHRAKQALLTVGVPPSGGQALRAASSNEQR